MKTAQNNLAKAKAEYKKRKASLVEEIAIFTKIIELYKKNVYSQNEKYGERVPDYTTDKKFDDASFEKRDMDKYR